MTPAVPTPEDASPNLQSPQIKSPRGRIINNARQSSGKDTTEILQGHVAFSAIFNPEEYFDPPRCHADTQAAVLETIDRWACNVNKTSKPILWLHGGPSAGKFAIVQTAAEQWAKNESLAASFCFSRAIAERNTGAKFVATLAYQIAQSIPSTRPHIERALLSDARMFDKSIRFQMTRLIAHPLEAVQADIGDLRMVVLVNGLDECSLPIGDRTPESQQQEILNAIAALTQDEYCPLCFLITSCPEKQICTFFTEMPLVALIQTINVSSTKESKKDIETYLKCSFDRVRANHPKLGSHWPPRDAVKHLVAYSSGQFKYASTVVRHVERPLSNPKYSLRGILDASKSRNTSTSLDTLYIHILRSVDPPSLQIVLSMLQIMVFGNFDVQGQQAFEGIFNQSPSFFERYHCLPPGSLYHHIWELHSVLQIPGYTESATTPIQFFDSSFREFLTDQTRSRTFYLDELKCREDLQSRKLHHVYIQSLSSDCGRMLGYNKNVLFNYLCLGLKGYPPSEDLVKGILALVGNNHQFSQRIAYMGIAEEIGSIRNKASMLDIFKAPSFVYLYGYLVQHRVDNAGYLFSEENIDKMLATSFEPEIPPEDDSTSNKPPEVEQAGRPRKKRRSFRQILSLIRRGFIYLFRSQRLSTDPVFWA